MALKQRALKPQDLLVVLKLAVNSDRTYTFASLAEALSMSASEVHASMQRAEHSRLLTVTESGTKPIRAALDEFVLHGVQYAFPADIGTVVHGMPTGAAGPILAPCFSSTSSMPFVWPYAQGKVRGIGLHPLYVSVPAAAAKDTRLYGVLTLIDAIRMGAARERELARTEFRRHIL